ncbi:MAG TPA: hypothetical protein PK033_00655 [Acetivibrio sp.]|jgi:hypothetical protein|nr:hypothetical protein [Clostridium sp.]HOQ36908.1 hypothetical protein [Acetivibrio sp.]HQA56379.1 hypothetical protein [Acetivibrio sp.]
MKKLKDRSSLFLGLLLIGLAYFILKRDELAFRYKLPFISTFTVLPGLILLNSFRVRKKKNLNPNKCLNIICIAIFFIGTILLILSYGWTTNGPYTRRSDYKYVYRELKEYYYPEMTEHLPKKIPQDASDLRFLYNRGFLQATVRLRLRYKTKPEEIAEILKKHNLLDKTDTYSVYDGYGNKTDYSIERFEYLLEEDEVPQGYIIVILYDGDHGRCGYGVCYDKNEVIYWLLGRG